MDAVRLDAQTGRTAAVGWQARCTKESAIDKRNPAWGGGKRFGLPGLGEDTARTAAGLAVEDVRGAGCVGGAGGLGLLPARQCACARLSRPLGFPCKPTGRLHSGPLTSCGAVSAKAAEDPR